MKMHIWILAFLPCCLMAQKVDIEALPQALLQLACGIYDSEGTRVYKRFCENNSPCSVGPLSTSPVSGPHVLAFFCSKSDSDTATSSMMTMDPVTTAPTVTPAVTPRSVTENPFYVLSRAALVHLARACRIDNDLVGMVADIGCNSRQVCGASSFRMNLFGVDSTISYCSRRLAAPAEKRIIGSVQRLQKQREATARRLEKKSQQPEKKTNGRRRN